MGTKDVILLDGKAVEAARLRRLMTIAELQAAVGCSSTTIYFARRGRPIGLVTARKLARALRVPLRSLIAPDRDAETVQEAAPTAPTDESREAVVAVSG